MPWGKINLTHLFAFHCQILYNIFASYDLYEFITFFFFFNKVKTMKFTNYLCVHFFFF